VHGGAAGSALRQELHSQLCVESRRKIRCNFFVRNRGFCPFKSDCIYLHELPAGRPPRRRRQRPRMPVVSGVTRPGGAWGTVWMGNAGPGLILSPVLQEFSPSPSESSDEEDEEYRMLEWALTLMETDFRYWSYGHEMLFTDSSDSD